MTSVSAGHIISLICRRSPNTFALLFIGFQPALLTKKKLTLLRTSIILFISKATPRQLLVVAALQ